MTDTTIYERITFSNKIFMYSHPDWIHEYPIVDIIKNLQEHSLIKYPYGKGSNSIKKYTQQYNHRLIGCDLQKLEDYNFNFIKGKIECIFIFSDFTDKIIMNIKNFSKSNNISLVEYSTLGDNKYKYIFNNLIFENTQELLNEIYTFIKLDSFKKAFNDSFVNFNLEDIPQESSNLNLNKCIEVLNQRQIEEQNIKDYRKIKHFDPHIKILNDFKKERNKANNINDFKGIVGNGNNILIQKFFKKK